MAFPTAPTNGQTATVNGILYAYNSTTNSWKRQLLSNLSVTEISGTSLTVTGNITGNTFIGNGSQLTGITAGTSNARAVGFSSVFGG